MEIDNLKCNEIAPCIFNENALQNVTSIFSSNKPLSKNFMNFRYVMCISFFFFQEIISDLDLISFFTVSKLIRHVDRQTIQMMLERLTKYELVCHVIDPMKTKGPQKI